MRGLALLGLGLLGACAPADDPCASLCEAATSAYAQCLRDWGLGWEAAGYADRADFTDACDTWAWEQRLLASEAAREGEVARGVVDPICAARDEALRSAASGCEAYLEMEWSGPVWQATDASGG